MAKPIAKHPASFGMHFCPTNHSDTYPFIDSKKANLKGKNVFITGASKGIGRAIAISYARAGASSIAIVARSSLSALETEIASAAKDAGHPKPKVVSYQMDVVDREAIERTAKQVDEVFSGRLDILVNNAGYLEAFVPIMESDPDEWWKTWTVNMRGPYLVTRAMLPIMLKGGDKQIVNMSSIGAHAKTPGASGYQTSKFALCRFTELIMAEYGEQGVVAFAVHPGGVLTELASNMPKNLHELLVDTPEVASDTIVFLTQEKREWLGGRYLYCTWDMEEFLRKKDEIVEKDLLKFRMTF